eukprot:3121258-Rhodomonas_salina.1
MEQQVDHPSSKLTLPGQQRRRWSSKSTLQAPSRLSKLPVDASRSAATTLEQHVNAPSSKSTLHGDQRCRWSSKSTIQALSRRSKVISDDVGAA